MLIKMVLEDTKPSVRQPFVFGEDKLHDPFCTNWMHISVILLDTESELAIRPSLTTCWSENERYFFVPLPRISLLDFHNYIVSKRIKKESSRWLFLKSPLIQDASFLFRNRSVSQLSFSTLLKGLQNLKFRSEGSEASKIIHLTNRDHFSRVGQSEGIRK